MSSSSRYLGLALLLALAFGAGFWVGRPHERTAAAASSQSAAVSTAIPPAAAPTPASPPAPAALSAEAEATAALAKSSAAERNFLFADLLRKLTPQNWRSVVAAFERERRATGKTRPDEMALLALRLGEVAGKEGAEFFAASKDYELLRKVLTGWAGQDPQAALNWIARDASEETRRTVKGAVIRGLAATEPDLAITALEGVPLAGRENYVINFASTLVQSVGIGPSEALIDAMAKRAIAAGSGDAEYMRRVFADFAALKLEHSFRNGEPGPAIEWLTRQLQQPYVDRSVITEAAALYGRNDPLAALGWLQSINQASSARDPNNTIGYQGLLYGWMQKEGPAAVGEWLLANPAQRNYDRLALNYATMIATQDPAAATKWANGIPNSAVKKQTLEALQRAAAAKKR